jgi:hypothetical protein
MHPPETSRITLCLAAFEAGQPRTCTVAKEITSKPREIGVSLVYISARKVVLLSLLSFCRFGNRTPIVIVGGYETFLRYMDDHEPSLATVGVDCSVLAA